MTAGGETLQLLVDKEQIRDVLYRYCRAVDRADIELLRTVYHPGATERHGDYDGPADGFFDFLLSRLRTHYELLRHSIGTIIIEVDGASAFSESSFEAACVLRQRAEDGGRRIRVHSGRYLDRFEQRESVWAIVQRVVVKDYIEIRTISDQPDSYPLARSDMNDLVYQLRTGIAAR